MQVEDYLMIERSLGDRSTDKIDAQMDIDEDNKFLFVSPVDNRIHLQPRLASLVPDPNALPSLVSFIGPTGVGKSTLVRMLVGLDGTIDAKHMPIAGAQNDAHSTSADIHIYAGGKVPNHSGTQSGDPKYPLLYVDSEGTGGSEEPRGIKRFRRFPFSPYGCTYKDFKHNRLKHVGSSYPRMLYIFSDVLCFVFSGDWREQASVVGPLIGWGTSAAFGAANQRRPQLILIFNKQGSDAAGVKFDDFRETYKNWIEGVEIGSRKQLLQYYVDPLVVCLPHADVNGLVVLRRVKLLYKQIRRSITTIRTSREQSHQLFTRRQLQLYMQLAADTFTINSDAEFDIYKASMARRPPPTGLSGYIVEFFREVQRVNSQHVSEFEKLRISFNILENRIKCSTRLWIGRLKMSLPVGPGAQLPKDLRKKLEQAQTDIDGGLPCAAYRVERGQRCHCDTVRGKHLDGFHASNNLSAKGNAFRWDGEFAPEPRLQRAADACRLVNLAESAIRDPTPLDVKVIRRQLSEVRASERLEHGLEIISSDLVCVCCIVELPTEVLSCGHIICAMCAKEEAETRSLETIIDLTCPVCLCSAKWYPKDLPPLAGYRILSLDGGGVRGIVELLSLERVMSFFPDMHVNDLFDIIVGTSFGGIIALALTVHALNNKPKTLLEVKKLFLNLCTQVFSTDMMRILAHYEWALRIFQFLGVYDTKYKPDNLLKLLKEHFGEESLLRSCVGGPRVIVTSCDRGNNLTGAWFTSYNRPMLENGCGNQTFEQALQGKGFGRVFDNHVFSAKDAAAATSAASTYFPAYKAHSRDWVDGGLRFNCPANIAIQEARILWPKRQGSALISLGCGQFPNANNAAGTDSLYSLLKGVVAVVTDAEGQSRDAMKYLKDCSLRLNPTIQVPNGKTCNLDEVRKIDFLMDETQKYLNSDVGLSVVQDAANLLFAALFYMDVEIDEDSQRVKVDMLRIRSRAALPPSLRRHLTEAMNSGDPPFSAIVDMGAGSVFFWAECTWIDNVMNLPFELVNLPMLRPLIVTVKLDMPLPKTIARGKWSGLPISGMPCSLDAAYK